MANTTPLYSLPLSTPFRAPHKSASKRKRHRKAEQTVQDDQPLPSPPLFTEYSAVVTPEERIQRRLAGQPVDEPPPAFPFPHAAPFLDSHEPDGRNTSSSMNASMSLKLQHLSVMVALLHRCLEARDYKRASHALALISRTEVEGKLIDLRHADLWGIGAEILLRTHPNGELGSISKQGFERAKVFYDKMALQHPWHRSWPHMVNAQDFKIAMFGLWIYVVCHEAKTLQSADVPDLVISQEALDKRLQAKRWEFAEAERIAQEMDALMGTLPFMDDLELIRLRAMTALWVADSLDTLEQLEAEAASTASLDDQEMEMAWLGLEREEQSHQRTPPRPNQKAVDARNLATAMFTKIGLGEDGRLPRSEVSNNVNISS